MFLRTSVGFSLAAATGGMRPTTLGPSAPSPIPQLHTQLMSTYFGRAAWESLTLQKPYITFWFSKWPESSCKPPSRGTRKVSGLAKFLHP